MDEPTESQINLGARDPLIVDSGPAVEEEPEVKVHKKRKLRRSLFIDDECVDEDGNKDTEVEDTDTDLSGFITSESDDEKQLAKKKRHRSKKLRLAKKDDSKLTPKQLKRRRKYEKEKAKKAKKASYSESPDDPRNPERKETSPSKSPNKTQSYERAQMRDMQMELRQLLDLLQDREATTHYEFPTKENMKMFLEAIKYAYRKEQEDAEAEEKKDYQCKGLEFFWDWWSRGMKTIANTIWQERCPDLVELHGKIPEYVKEQKESLDEIYAAVLPNKISFYEAKKWVAHEMNKKGHILNPASNDKEVAETALKFLSDKFILLDVDGTSIVWEPEPHLWVMRRKERSAIALGSALTSLLDTKIIFTDDKLKTAWKTRCSNNGAVHNILVWMKGAVPIFPNPIRVKLDRERWHVPILEHKLVDLTTLDIRTRNPVDLFTTETSFAWIQGVPKGDVIIMDEKLFDEFKDACKVDRNKAFDLLYRLCPNAMKFIAGPFRNKDRLKFALLHLGLSLTTHCIRKAIWIFGDGRGMKSTMMAAITKCLGHLATALTKKVFFVSGSDASHNTDLMRAEGKRLVYVDELEKKDALKETIYKLYTAQQKISARQIFGSQDEWDPIGTLWLLLNAIPSMQFSDHSIPDRILPIKGTTRVFTVNGDPSERPPHFKNVDEWKDGEDEETGLYWVLKDPVEEKWADLFLKPESEGGHQNELGTLLVLAAHLAYKTIEDKTSLGEIPVPDIVKKDRMDFMREADQVGQYLADNCSLDARGSVVEFKDIWRDYKGWCTEQGVRPMEMKQLKASLRQKSLLIMKKFKSEKTGKLNGAQLAVKVAMKQFMVEDDERKFE